MTPEEKQAHAALDAAGVQKTRQGKRLTLPERIALLAADRDSLKPFAEEYKIVPATEMKRKWQEWQAKEKEAAETAEAKYASEIAEELSWIDNPGRYLFSGKKQRGQP